MKGFVRSAWLAGLALAPACGESDGGATDASARAAPSVTLARLEDIEQALAARRGQACLLNFWATWCAPCVAELPDLLDVAAEFEPRGVRVLGVSYDLMLPDMEPAATLELVRGFLVQRELALSTLILDAPDYAAIDARFELPGPIPVTLAFDAHGRIVDRHEGEASRERFAQMMRKALGE